MKNGKVKEFWRKHKGKIIIAGIIVIGGIAYITIRKSKIKIPTNAIKPDSGIYNYDNLGEALEKFKEIIENTKNLTKKEVALYSYENRIFTAIDL